MLIVCSIFNISLQYRRVYSANKITNDTCYCDVWFALTADHWLVLCIDDSNEVWFEWRSADQKPINVGLLGQLLTVISRYWTCQINIHAIYSMHALLNMLYTDINASLLHITGAKSLTICFFQILWHQFLHFTEISTNWLYVRLY